MTKHLNTAHNRALYKRNIKKLEAISRDPSIDDETRDGAFFAVHHARKELFWLQHSTRIEYIIHFASVQEVLEASQGNP